MSLGKEWSVTTSRTKNKSLSLILTVNSKRFSVYFGSRHEGRTTRSVTPVNGRSKRRPRRPTDTTTRTLDVHSLSPTPKVVEPQYVSSGKTLVTGQRHPWIGE